MSDVNTDFQDAELRRELGLADDARLNKAVRVMMKHRRQFTQQETGVEPQVFDEYCKLFAQGIQWVAQEYPQVAGPSGVFFGNNGSAITLNNNEGSTRFPIVEVPRFARGSRPEDAYILIPLQDVSSLLSTAKTRFTAQERLSLGEFTPQEAVFLAGVEESYHAVQHQDLQLCAKLEAEERKLQSDEGALDALFSGGNILTSAPVEHHDIAPRELDVVPVLERALADFRKKQKQTGIV
jgi:hypothetical protein